MNRVNHHTKLRNAVWAALPIVLAATAMGRSPGIGPWMLSPYLELSGAYDSNVYKTKDHPTSDMYAEPELGLRFGLSGETNLLRLSGNLFVARREYAAERALSFNTFGDNASLRYDDEERTTAELIQSFRRVSDNDRHASDIESSGLSASMVQDIHSLSARRDVNQAGATMDRRLTDKTRFVLGYRYASSVYDEPGFFDLQGHVGQADLAYNMTDKTAAFVTLRHGQQHQETTPGWSKLSTLRFGVQNRGTEKISCKIGAGIERYERPPDTGDERSDAFNFDASADWYVTEKVTLRCGGYNGTQMSSFYRGNGLTFISGWAGAGYRWRPSTTFSIRGVYRVDDYLDQVPYQNGTIDRKDRRVEAHARADYAMPSNLLKLFLDVSHDHVDSNDEPVDYTDTRVTIGADIRF